ncbi:hypothetical protein E8A74_31755 [Polyangium fumosum]|uniref:Uncharacterized protein n=2 Tax=Polyangium fumosum TaxID=889272 RepID=A0A4V5PRB0_9BACT|nr:hypothetical protein E8A74_31755 [Polyangium fumosum]
MPGPVDVAYLRAACEAFPLASEASHRQLLLSLGKNDEHLLDAPTQKLADALKDWIRPRSRGHSLESLRQIRDLAWFDETPGPVDMADYLLRLAKRSLTQRGGHIALRTSPTIEEPLAHFRWLSLLLPPDLLVAACSVDMRTDPAVDYADLLTPHLASRLEKDVAETHLHVGAASSFQLLWIGLMSRLPYHPLDTEKLGRGGTPPFGSPHSFHRMLQAAAMTRLFLAGFLWRRDRIGRVSSFQSFIDDPEGPLRRCIAPLAAWPAGEDDFVRVCVLALRMVVFGGDAPPAALLASAHRRLLGPKAPRSAKTMADVLEADPLTEWLGGSHDVATTETRLSRRGLAYLLHEGRKDRPFARAFWQYQRIRALTFRHLSVEPGTAGLGWFQQHYERISPLRSCIDGAGFDVAVHSARRGVGLAAIEMRTSPERSWAKVRDLVREACVPSVDDKARPEVGLVLHFLKKDSRKHAGKKRLNADPRQRGHGCRFGAFSFGCMEEAAAIAVALTHQPELLLVLRGIDVASDELSVPTWAFVLPFERVRRAAHRAGARLARTHPHWKVKPLGATYHAGEDFRRLAEGLRRMHELLEFGLLEAGDRIGHGLAAGVDPERWAREHPVTVQPVEERLLDLLWELDWYKSGELPADAGRVEQVRAEALDLTKRMFGACQDLDHLGLARRSLHESAVLRRLGYPFVHGRVPEDDIEKLVHRYLTDAPMFARGQDLVEVRMSDGELRMLRLVGHRLRVEIARREMTIEANPTSNLLINDMGSVDSHPAFRFQPIPGGSRHDEQPVQLSINTDDPISFATSLGDEYAYLYGALLSGKVGAHHALQWLAARRDDGFRSRFTLPASSDLKAVHELSPSRR